MPSAVCYRVLWVAVDWVAVAVGDVGCRLQGAVGGRVLQGAVGAVRGRVLQVAGCCRRQSLMTSGCVWNTDEVSLLPLQYGRGHTCILYVQCSAVWCSTVQ